LEVYTIILLLVEKVFLIFGTFACLGLVDINSMASWFFRESKMAAASFPSCHIQMFPPILI